MSKNVYIGFWEILLICITMIVIVGMLTDYNVDVGKDGGCVDVRRR